MRETPLPLPSSPRPGRKSRDSREIIFLETLTLGHRRGAGAAALLLERAAHADLAAYILVRLEDDDVDLGRVETDEGDGRAQADGHAERGDLRLVGVAGAKVDGHEGEPDDARGIHGEADELALVEVLRYPAGLHRVHGRDEDQQGVVQLGEEEAHVLDVALEDHLAAIRVRVPGARRLDDHPDQREHHLGKVISVCVYVSPRTRR